MANIYGGIDLIGGGTGAIDKINGSVLNDKDIFVTIKDGIFYSHWLDDDSGAGENSPLIISPDLNAGTKRWLLAGGVFADIILPDGGTIGQSAGPLLTFDDTNNYLEITGCRVGIGLSIPLVVCHIKSSNEILRLETTNDVSSGGACYLLWADSSATRGFIGFGGENNQIQFHNYISGGDIVLTTTGGGKIGAGESSPKTQFTIGGTLTLKEQAAADGDNAGYGQIFVKTATPCQLWFRRDDGSEIRLDT